MKPGDIVHISGLNTGAPREQDAWVVVGVPVYEEKYVRATLLEDNAASGHIWYVGEPVLISSTYRFAVVPDDQVPERIWAVLARLKLS